MSFIRPFDVLYSWGGAALNGCPFGVSLVQSKRPWPPTGAFCLGDGQIRLKQKSMDQSYSDTFLTGILRSVHHVACVGVSLKPTRPSYYVARYLSLKGFRITGVNPAYAGQYAFGEKIVASLSEIASPVDMVDIFRRSEEAGAVVDEALSLMPQPATIWMQIGVIDQSAAQRAEAAGSTVVMNRCPKIEYQRLFGELRMAGFNTGVISSKL